jgi:hypothetical protein
VAIHHKNFAETTLAAAITDTSGTSITVTSEASFPAAPFIISIDTEAMLVTNVSTTTWTVTRGYEGSTAATHLNGAAIYHDISAAEADVISSITAAGLALLDDANAAAQLVTLGALPLAGGTMTGNLIMDNMDVTLVKLLTLHGEIDDGNSGTADMIDWNAGAAHKSTLTGNVTLAFTGYGTDLCSGGTVSTSGNDLEAGANAFDNSTSTQWKGDYNLPAWLQYQLASAATVTVYSILPPSGVNNPKDWTLQGSNNGSTFTTIDTVSAGFVSGDNTVKYFAVDSPGSYTYYRIVITATVSAGTRPWIKEMELIASSTLDPPAPCFLTLKLVQDGTGGRTVTWPATVKGSPVINPAASSTSVVVFYWDGTSYWTLNGLPWVTAPAASNSAGFAGQMAYDASYIYVCTAANTWERVAVATW